MHLRHAKALLWCLALLAAPLVGSGAAGSDVLAVLSADISPVSSSLPTDVGSGRLAVTLFTEGEIFSWSANLTGVTGGTKAHLHLLLDEAPIDGIGPVAVVLSPVGGMSAADNLPPDQLMSGDVTLSGTFNATKFRNLAADLTAVQFVEKVRSNRVYMVVHTVERPDGALRGPVVEVPGSAGLPPSPGLAPAAAPPPQPATMPPSASMPPPSTSQTSAQTVSAVLTPPSGPVGVTTGTFTATLANGKFAWELEFRDVMGLTKVHIHLGDSMVGGDLVVGLLPLGAENPNIPFDPPINGSPFYESWFGPGNFSSELEGASIERFMELVAEGQLFINCHTVDAPGGALRGVLKASSGPPVTWQSPAGPTPPSPPAYPPASKSSVPIGAIVGGVVGGVVVIAAAAALFVWSRRRTQRGGGQAQLEEGGSQSKLGPSLDFSQSKQASGTSAWQPGPGTDTFIPGSRVAPVPFQRHSPSSRQSLHSASSAARSKPPLENDPFLSFISSRLSSQPGTASGGSAVVAPPGVGSNGSSGGISRGSSMMRNRPDMQQLAIKWEDLVMEECIGSGSFGRVYRARYFQTAVAVKILLDPTQHNGGSDTEAGFAAGSLQPPPALMRSLEEETRVLSRIRHPNVLSLMGMCEKPACIITEYCQNGSLYDVLRDGASDPNRAAHLTWKLRLGMAIDAATGILYLHSRSPPIIHRDLKSPNLLVDKHFNVKVGDFNLSKILEEHNPTTTSANSMGGAFNPLWLAPEVLRGDKATAASDVFSFGVVLFELLTWRLPWVGLSTFKIMQAVLNGQRPEVPPPEALPGTEGPFPGLDAYCQLMRECWVDDPSERPHVGAIIARLDELLPLASSPSAPSR